MRSTPWPSFSQYGNTSPEVAGAAASASVAEPLQSGTPYSVLSISPQMPAALLSMCGRPHESDTTSSLLSAVSGQSQGWYPSHPPTFNLLILCKAGIFGMHMREGAQLPASQSADSSVADMFAQTTASGTTTFPLAFGFGASAPAPDVATSTASAFASGAAPAPWYGPPSGSATASSAASDTAPLFGGVSPFGASSTPASGATSAGASSAAAGASFDTGSAFGGARYHRPDLKHLFLLLTNEGIRPVEVQHLL